MTSGKDLKLRRIAADVKAVDLVEAARTSDRPVSTSQISRWENSRIVTEDAEARYMALLSTCITKSTTTSA